MAKALAQLPELRLIHCPRHVERVGADDIRPKWSSGARPRTRQRQVVVDQYGVMADAYAYADVVVLGGTFTKRVGGHSPIEALNAGRPVVVGPHVAAQQSIMDILVPTGAVGLPAVSSMPLILRLNVGRTRRKQPRNLLCLGLKIQRHGRVRGGNVMD